MAYPLKQLTVTKYNNLRSDAYEYVSNDKIYYMPKITDGVASWSLKLYDINDQEGQPIVDLSDVIIKTGYRVLMTTALSGSIKSDLESYLVLDSGYDNEGNKWIKTSPNLSSLPIGTSISWTVNTQSYSAKTNGNYSSGFEFIGTYLYFGPSGPPPPGPVLVIPIPLPINGDYVYTKTKNINVYKNRIYVIDVNNNVLLNQEFDPTSYEISNFLVKNEVNIL